MVLEELYKLIQDRKDNGQEGSYTKYLLDKGTNKILKKIGEECSEVLIAAKDNNKDEIVSEICDLVYHLLVLMVDKEVEIDNVREELIKRNSKINNFKGERKAIENI